MKDQARLRRLIRKIVKEEIEKIKPEHFPPVPPREPEEPEWGMFDEIEFDPMHTNEAPFELKKQHPRALPGWSEPTESLESPPFRAKKKNHR